MPYKNIEDVNRSNRQSYRKKILKKLGEESWEQHIESVEKRKAARLIALPEYNRMKALELRNDPIRLARKRKREMDTYWRKHGPRRRKPRRGIEVAEAPEIIKKSGNEWISDNLLDML